MNPQDPITDPQKANEVGVLSFILNRVLMQQRMLAAVIAKVEDRTEAEVLERMNVMIKQTEQETIHYLKKYWIPDSSGTLN